MKKVRFPISTQTSFDINILPLIDVLFAVLLFFILSSLLLTKRYNIQINRPEMQAPSLSFKKEDSVIVSIDQNKNILLGSRPVDFVLLEKMLSEKHNINPIKHLLIDADRSIEYGFMMNVLGIARRLNISSIGLTVDPGP